MKKIQNQINGVLLLDKPLGMSSNLAIQKVKRILNAEKVGHTGTLDPMATGLLPICLGEATKFASYLLDGDKEYLATAQLGIITDSGDSEGNIVANNLVSTDLQAINCAISNFTANITQVPPMYSALKYNGKPLYEYAREGVVIDRPARNVSIYELELVDYNAELQQIKFRARVSKGTYIRTLAEDIGNYLGCGASLIGLRRTHSNQFNIADSYQIFDLESISNWQLLNIMPVDVLCCDLPIYHITDEMFVWIKNGNPCSVTNIEDRFHDCTVRLYLNGKFLGIAKIKYEHDRFMIFPKRMISNLNSL